ncbi:putative tad2-trna-specific adenosine deaminase 2 [Fusarium sporotrichioides]|uniref:Putative tad2-trna-specific adenosine deaminase 2 n=1 Tax=Fusarium sporotrichioides TaxID=5514 RepID=A0A395RLF8_FUSSP|nr:putative tad2-trna-specific adenosine deaminase 2 [Fusarium sporotrichioides]
MGVLQSLGLSTAKKAGAKAIRRLFGRVMPGESDGVTANNSDSASASDTDQTGKGNASNGSNHRQEISEDNNEAQQNRNPDSSSSPSALKSQTNTTTTDYLQQQENLQTTATLASASNMQSLQNQSAQNGDADKENQPPSASQLSESLARLEFQDDKSILTSPKPVTPVILPAPIFTDPAVVAERAMHMKFTEAALDMLQARLALQTNETPVGCVLVHDGRIIARGMNATNVTRNGTRHAEFMALGALLSYPTKDGPRTTFLKPKAENQSEAASETSSIDSGLPDEGNEDGAKGHLYPYGQKCHPDARVDRSIIRESILYVTVEPCVMCASLLRQLGIKKVYFGAVNDKFGGTGGVFSIHANSLPVSTDGQTASAHPTPKPAQLLDGSGTLGVSYPPGGGDGGNIESGYEIEGGWGRDEAVGLLRRFYVQENGRAPVPRKKEGRAARLAAMLEGEGNGEDAPTPDITTPVPETDSINLPTSTETLKEQAEPLADRTNV